MVGATSPHPDMPSAEMDRHPQRPEARLLERLAQRWMRVDRAGDVLQSRPHLDRQREARRKLGYAGADRLDAEYEMIVGAGDDADEAILALAGHRPAVCPEGKLPDLDLDPCRSRPGGRQPDRDDLG